MISSPATEQVGFRCSAGLRTALQIKAAEAGETVSAYVARVMDGVIRAEEGGELPAKPGAEHRWNQDATRGKICAVCHRTPRDAGPRCRSVKGAGR